MTAGDTMGQAIDLYRQGRELDAAKLAGPLVDFLRARGCTYPALVRMAERVRPGFDAGDFEGLMQACDESEGA